MANHNFFENKLGICNVSFHFATHEDQLTVKEII